MPGHAVQVDVKFIAPLPGSSRKKYYQFTAIDDCTRIRALRSYDQLNQKTAIQFADFLASLQSAQLHANTRRSPTGMPRWRRDIWPRHRPVLGRVP